MANSTFTRRDFAKAGIVLAASTQLQRADQAAVCRLAAEQEEGPFYIAGELLRSDIVEGKPGVPLALRIVLLEASSCKPRAGAAVDLWHCDALGLYSGFTKQNGMGPGPGMGPGMGRGPGGPPPPRDGMGMGGPPPDGPPPSRQTDKLTFLRGIQVSDANGVVNYQTVFPGFYMGRTNHIHFKVRIGDGKSFEAGHVSHTGQLFFPEELAVKLMAHEPYSKHKIHRTTQEEDHVYGDQHGELSIARVAPLHGADLTAGMSAELIATIDSKATPARVGFGPGGPRFGGPR